MKKIVMGMYFIIVLAGKVYGETTNRIIAVVNDEIITQAELDHKKNFLLSQIKYSRDESADISEAERKEIEKTVIDKLIVNRLIMQEAKKQNIVATEAEVKEMLDDVKKKFPSEDAFEASLNGSGLTMDDLRESYGYEVIMRKIFYDKMRHEIVINPQELDKFYQQHKEFFQEPEKTKLKNVLIKKEGRSPEEISAKLDAIIAMLREGTTFEDVATKYSEGANAIKGGEMGYIKRGEVSANIENIIFSLNPGKISGWIETGTGFYLFKVEERLPARMLDFNAAQDQIKTALFNQKMSEKFDKWVAQLKEKAYIEIIQEETKLLTPQNR